MDLYYEKYLEITGKTSNSLLESVVQDELDEKLFAQSCREALTYATILDGKDRVLSLDEKASIVEFAMSASSEDIIDMVLYEGSDLKDKWGDVKYSRVKVRSGKDTLKVYDDELKQLDKNIKKNLQIMQDYKEDNIESALTKGSKQRAVWKDSARDSANRDIERKKFVKSRIAAITKDMQDSENTLNDTGIIMSVKKLATNLGDRVSSTDVGRMMDKKLGPNPTKNGAIIGVGAIALTALLIYGAAKTYKRFFSAAAKACSNKSGGDKTACMKNYKIKALQAQIKDLQTGSKACAKSKDPAKCKAVIKRKLEKLQNKLQKLK